jgi:hypothetical protein
MAVVIDATPGGANANSYVTLAVAKTYYEAHSHPELWEDADDDQRNRALVSATRLIDEHLDFDGYAVDETQRLQWPRYGLLTANGFTLPSDAIPERLQMATAEYARFLLQADRSGERDDELNAIQELEAGPVRVEFVENKTVARQVVPDEILAMLRIWVTSSPGRDTAVKLLRA